MHLLHLFLFYTIYVSFVFLLNDFFTYLDTKTRLLKNRSRAKGRNRRNNKVRDMVGINREQSKTIIGGCQVSNLYKFLVL
jgi:hypothetical protein